MEIFNYLLSKKGKPRNVSDDLFSYLLGKNAGGGEIDIYGEGTTITLNGTANAPMRITLNPTALSQDGTPTPDNPQDIHTISGSNSIVVEGKNLIYEYHKSGNLIYLNGATRYEDYIFKAGTYTFSYKDTNNCLLTIKDTTGEQTSLGYAKVTTFTSNYDFNIWLYRSGITLEEVSEIQLEKGSTATTYEPYQSNTQTIDLSTYNLGSIGNYENKFIRSGGENLLLNTLLTTATTKNGITATPNNDGSVSLSGTSTATTYFNLTNTDFGTTSFNSVYGGSTEYVANTGNTNTNIRIAYDSGNKYTYIQVNNATTTNVTIFPMINKGTTALPYVPYEKGWYYKEGIGKVVLNGSESWTKQTTWSAVGNNTNAFYIGKPTNLDSTQTCFSDYFTHVTTNTITSVDDYGIAYASNLIIRVPKSIDTNSDLQIWLSNNNVTIYYVLVTPTYTKITDTTLINQLENIYKNMLSYKGTTNISQVNNDLPFELKVVAKGKR